MDSIISAVNGIYEFLLSIVDFVGTLLSDLADVVENLLEVSVSIPDYLELFLPTPVVTVLVSMIGIAVIFRVVGRSS